MPIRTHSADGTGAAPCREDADIETDAQVPMGTNSAETPEEREARVEKLREQIAAGTYKPDARELAAKIIEASLRGKR